MPCLQQPSQVKSLLDEIRELTAIENETEARTRGLREPSMIKGIGPGFLGFVITLLVIGVVLANSEARLASAPAVPVAAPVASFAADAPPTVQPHPTVRPTATFRPLPRKALPPPETTRVVAATPAPNQRPATPVHPVVLSGLVRGSVHEAILSGGLALTVNQITWSMQAPSGTEPTDPKGYYIVDATIGNLQGASLPYGPQLFHVVRPDGQSVTALPLSNGLRSGDLSAGQTVSGKVALPASKVTPGSVLTFANAIEIPLDGSLPATVKPG